MLNHKSVPNVLLIVKMTNDLIKLRLYISGQSPNSITALKNLKTICDDRFHDSHFIEVIDLYEHPHRAIEDGVMLTPMLFIDASPPVSVVGNLSDTSGLINLLLSANKK